MTLLCFTGNQNMDEGRLCRTVNRLVFVAISLLLLQMVSSCTAQSQFFETTCSTNLRPGQYICPPPEVDPATQQPKGCTQNNTANTTCLAVDGIICTESGNSSFTREIPCLWTNGYSFETSLLLSIFLGMFGADRFYLGYPAMGLFKLCTLGCMFLGQLIDIILIATQTIGPADGSHYVMSYFGARLIKYELDNETYRMPQPDWQEL